MKKLLSIVLTVALAITMFTGCSCGYGKKVDKEAGFEVDKYIKLGKYTGFNYDITQKKFDELLDEKTFEATEVSRAAKQGDEIEFSYTGYINGKNVDDLSQNSVAVETNKNDNDVYKKFTDALIGKKKGDHATVKLSGADASKISNSKKKYTDEVTFKLKVIDINEVKYSKVTDEWVKDESEEDASNTKEFYDIIEVELEDNAKADLWQKAVDNATMSSWPPELYNKVKEEEEADARYNADQWDMSLNEYYKMNGDTKESLEKEYMNQVKSILVMWEIVKEEEIKVTDEDITKKYEELFNSVKDDGDYKTVDDLKKDYSKKEIKEAVYLEKAQNYVYDNSNVKKTYKVPTN
ncbi:MAG: FKBP-type peptidyl-prolyl cis-trans isomerase [Eubacterium sp.]|nr:FKBP-type peptidyl-prolyl cis-trans isomerase [Eubacterium sp.]